MPPESNQSAKSPKNESYPDYLNGGTYPASPSLREGVNPYAEYLNPQSPGTERGPSDGQGLGGDQGQSGGQNLAGGHEQAGGHSPVGEVHGLSLGQDVDPAIPQAPDTLAFLPAERANDGGFVPQAPQRAGKTPRALRGALGVMWFLLFFLALFVGFVVVTVLKDVSGQPGSLSRSLTYALLAVIALPTIASIVCGVLAYRRLWALIALNLLIILMGTILLYAGAGPFGYAPLVGAVFGFLPVNLRYYSRTRAYRRAARSYGDFTKDRQANRRENLNAQSH